MHYRRIGLWVLIFLFAGWTNLGAQDEAASSPAEPAAEEKVRILALAEAVRIAQENHLDYLREIEDVYLAGLGLRLTEHQYGPLFSGSLDVEYQGGANVDKEATQDLSLQMQQKLPLGGDLTLSAGSSGLQSFMSGGEDAYSSSLSLSLRQPLGQDAGHLVYREELTDAERSFIYTTRAQELFRQGFFIDVASDYFRILQNKKAIETNRRALEMAKWTLEQAEALRKLGDTTAIDVSRMANDVLSSEDRLNSAIQRYELSLDNFKIDLRLPLEEKIELVAEELEYRPVEVDLKEAVQTALARRLELLTARDQLEDSRRSLALAKQELKPRLDFVASFSVPTETGVRLGRQSVDAPYWSTGLELEIPFDKWSERTSYRRAYISYIRQRRSFERRIDEIIIEVRGALRDLQQAGTSIRLQKLNKVEAEHRLKSAEYDLLLEAGRRGTRELLDAKDALFDAEIAYDRAVVDYLVAKMNLKKAMGTIIIDEKGEWAR